MSERTTDVVPQSFEHERTADCSLTTSCTIPTHWPTDEELRARGLLKVFNYFDGHRCPNCSHYLFDHDRSEGGCQIGYDRDGDQGCVCNLALAGMGGDRCQGGGPR